MHYGEVIDDKILPFLKTLVERIQIELDLCHKNNEKNNIVINKCWNIIRVSVDSELYVPKY